VVVIVNAILFFLPGDQGFITLALWVAQPFPPALPWWRPILPRVANTLLLGCRFLLLLVDTDTNQETVMHPSYWPPSCVEQADDLEPPKLTQIVQKASMRDRPPDESTPSPWRRAGGAYQAVNMRRKMKQDLCSLWSLLRGMSMTRD